jgi:hypothetical protein
MAFQKVSLGPQISLQELLIFFFAGLLEREEVEKLQLRRQVWSGSSRLPSSGFNAAAVLPTR